MELPKIRFAGTGERFQYLTHKSNDTTIRFVLDYPGLIDPERLCEAVKRLVDRVDILHASYFIDGASAYWRIHKELRQTDYFHLVQTDGDPAVTARSLSVLPVDPKGRCQLRCTLVLGRERSSMVLSISHLVVDGGDGKYLLNKLIESYHAPESLTVKDGSRAPEQVYKELELKDFKELMRMPLSTEASSAYPFPTEEPGLNRVTTAVIPRSIMDNARKKAKALGATANDLLTAACYEVYARFPEVDRTAPVSISSMIDLRRHCTGGESAGLGNMSGGMATVLKDGVPEVFEETLRLIAEQSNALKADPLAGLAGMPILHGMSRAIPIGLLLAFSDRVYGQMMPVGLTNLGNLRSTDLALEGLCPNGAAFGGPLKKKRGFQISVISLDGECTLACYGQYTAEDQAHIQKTLSSMAAVIEAYAAA